MQIHPESNLYYTVSKLGLPVSESEPCLPVYLLQYLLYPELHEPDELKKNESEFLQKTSEGDFEHVHSLVEAGVNLNVRDERSNTALMNAAAKGHIDIVKLLLDRGAGVNVQDKESNTALMNAASKGHIDIVKLLLDRGTEVNFQDKEGYTALMEAASFGYIDIVKLLLNRGAEVNIHRKDVTALSLAVFYGHVDCVNKLIEAGADVNDNNNCQGDTPLIGAVNEVANIGTVKELIHAGADLNMKSKGKWTALMTASDWETDNCFHELIQAGAEIPVAWLADIARKLMKKGKQNRI